MQPPNRSVEIFLELIKIFKITKPNAFFVSHWGESRSYEIRYHIEVCLAVDMAYMFACKHNRQSQEKKNAIHNKTFCLLRWYDALFFVLLIENLPLYLDAHIVMKMVWQIFNVVYTYYTIVSSFSIKSGYFSSKPKCYNSQWKSFLFFICIFTLLHLHVPHHIPVSLFLSFSG